VDTFAGRARLNDLRVRTTEVTARSISGVEPDVYREKSP